MFRSKQLTTKMSTKPTPNYHSQYLIMMNMALTTMTEGHHTPSCMLLEQVSVSKDFSRPPTPLWSSSPCPKNKFSALPVASLLWIFLFFSQPIRLLKRLLASRFVVENINKKYINFLFLTDLFLK